MVTLIVSQHPDSPDSSNAHQHDDSGDILHATLRNTTTHSNSSSDEDETAALSRPIVPGEEVEILIDKGQTGLGLSIVGGSDTLLVC